MSHRPHRRWFAPWREVCACGQPAWPCPVAQSESVSEEVTFNGFIDEPRPPRAPESIPPCRNPVYRPHHPNGPDWSRQASRGFHVNPTDPKGDTPAHGTNMGAFSQ